MQCWAFASVGVKSLEDAYRLWLDIFGFEIEQESHGPDAGLAALWGIKPDDIAGQAVVKTPGFRSGKVHFVEFVQPNDPVRQNADVFDLCPKNLDIHVQNLPSKVEQLKSLGFQFRSDTFSEMTTNDGIRFREIQMPAHDGLNVVLLEVIGEDLQYTSKGFAGVGLGITIVDDAEQEALIYEDVLGLARTSENVLKGPEIEQVVGLPPGAFLDIKILGDPDDPFGRVELVAYQGVQGKNLYALAKPKALGFLNMHFMSENLEGVQQALVNQGIQHQNFDSLETLLGHGPATRFETPTGFQLFVHGRS